MLLNKLQGIFNAINLHILLLISPILIKSDYMIILQQFACNRNFPILICNKFDDIFTNIYFRML